MLATPSLQKKKILLVDKDDKKHNDRTWCFWENNPGFFEEIVCKKWDKLLFKSDDFTHEFDINPYQYKMIRGIDFYNYCMQKISASNNVKFIKGDISNVNTNVNNASITVDSIEFTADYVFNSIPAPVIKQKNKFYLLQHFKGCVIQTPNKAFNSNVATLMDFTTSQHNGTTFFYVMPLADNTALVEYTVFSKEVLADAEYSSALKNYIEATLLIKDYTIVETEFGVIPMSNQNFKTNDGRVINIGAAAGKIKPSSGYAFMFIQKHCNALVQSLSVNNHPYLKNTYSKKYLYYDSVMLDVLSNNNNGSKIFSAIFRQNNIQSILRFLDNESSLREELKLIKGLNNWQFFKAGIKQLFA